MPVSADLQRQLSRFSRLAQIDDVWEGTFAPMPMWIDGETGGDPYRPIGAVWVSTKRRLAHSKLTENRAEVDESTALAALVELGMSSKLAGYRPRAIRVSDARLAAWLTDALAPCGIAVEIVDHLPALDEFMTEMAAHVGEERVPAALAAPGVTPARLAAFAEAAKEFYAAAPWRHLDDGDLVRVEAPKAGRGLVLFAVMGSGGEQFGLGFFSSKDQYRAMTEGRSAAEVFQRGGEWAVYLSPPWETAFADLDAWDRHGFALASERAYPTAVRLDPAGGATRPDAGRLAYFEGLLRALAATSEAEMDSGRWSREVQTADGPVTYGLALPDLLAPAAAEPSPRAALRSMERMRAEMARTFKDQEFNSPEEFKAALESRFGSTSLDDLPSTATTPLERAQDLMYEAFEARGRRQVQLVRRALELSPDCADAYVLLAERTPSSAEARGLYEQAVAAGERALGPGAFEDSDRSFWGDVTTRPYMRARFGLADCLVALGEIDAALGHYRALLALNPDDNQAVRYRVLTLLLDDNRNAEAEAFLAEDDEPTALWTYAAVLLGFRAGDVRLARARLKAALRSNRHVPRFLTGQRDLPHSLPAGFAYGSPDEAMLCAAELIGAWEQTPGAVAWLRTETRGRR